MQDSVAETASPRSAPRGWRLSTLLFLYGASLVVPALIATGLLLDHDARRQVEAFDRRTEQVAADLANDIDGQLQLMAATLSVLAGSLAHLIHRRGDGCSAKPRFD